MLGTSIRIKGLAVAVVAATTLQRVGRNGGHGFWDIGRGECWSCPMGSVRTVFPVNQDWACNLGGILNPSYARAEYLGT
ncbi:MAG: hypothetical protein ACFCVH_09780 [Alphaproteobacteria bacterium]